MRLSNFTMSMLLAVPLALAGCDNGDGDEGSNNDSSGDDTTTTSDDTTTTAPADDTTTTSDDTTGPTEPRPCEVEQVIPPPPVDCSGADGVIMGDVYIQEDGDDPSILEGVVRIEGLLSINRTEETDLNFMACVQEVTEEISIFGNESLTNVDGLWSLTDVGTDFIFSENTAIVDFNGLPNLPAIAQNLIIKNNDSLETITGFHSLVGIEGNLTIQNNDSLMAIDGLGGLMLVNGVLAITANGMLCRSSIACVGEGITVPPVPPEEWSTQGNNNDC